MWMLEQENTTILCLIANGSHVDHFNVREALLHAAYLMGDEAQAQIVFTEDEPYTSANLDQRYIESGKLTARSQDGLNGYKLPVRVGETGMSLMHEIFNKHYRTQWTQDYEDSLNKNEDFIYYILDKSAYKSLTKDDSCTEGYCTLA
jgi:hypothetical protein